MPLVLAGPPRSGTTLFSAFLDGHSEINWLPDEGFFFEHLHALSGENFERFVRAAALGSESLLEGLRDRALMPPLHRPLSDFPSLQYDWSEQRFRAVVESRKPRSVSELWALLRDAYLAGLGYTPRRYVSLKAADYGRSIFGALDHFSDARGIVIVREPIATLNSLKAYRQKRNVKLLTWPTLVQAIVDMNRLAALADRYSSDHLRILRYEDFTTDIEITMRGVCDWLGIRFEPVLLQPSMMSHPWTSNSSFGTGESGIAPLPDKRVTMMSPAERDYALWALEPFRSRFGYA